MKKFFKWFAIILGSLILVLVLWAWSANETKPTATPSAKADALAQKMLAAIDKPAWDTTHWVQWNFANRHQFLWDKERHFTRVTWEDIEVRLDINQVSGKAFQNGAEVTGDAAQELIRSAWEYFCNDSFWLNAPAKAFDPGTERSLVTLADGRQGLMVNYASGGVTPGDAYVWILDDSGLPKSYKMWVKIIPIGGMEFTWEDWKTLNSGAKIAGLHKGLFEVPILDVKDGKSYSDFGLTADPFTGM